jgi:peptidyl-prolyl cis-trans isomerase D
MALIGKIRKNSWLLVVVIGLALAGFVIMDMTSQAGQSGAQQLTLLDVDGTKTDYMEFQNAEEILYQGSNVDVFSRRNYLYNYYLDKAIVEKEAEALGLAVPIPELMDLQFGAKLSPLIEQRFLNPSTNQVDRVQLNSIRQAINAGTLTPSLQQLWAHQEKEIIKERLQDKLTNMVAKGFYTPTWMVEKKNDDQSVRTDFVYVRIPYEEVPDNEISYSESDLQNYLKNNKADFEQVDHTRTIDFLVYDVLPTSEDSIKLKSDLEEQIERFKTTENDTLFVENNYGTFDFAYVKKEMVSPVIADSVFLLPEGTVIGPYIEANAYKAVKIRDRMIIPDSVRARHILRKAATLEEYQAAQKTIDSLKNLIESGTDRFDSLAVKFSEGSLSVTLNGGDLGYAGLNAYVKPFNDVAFFFGEEDSLYAVITEFGIHLIEILDKKYINNDEGVQLAYLNTPIIPSEETQTLLYEDVLEFTGNNRTIESVRSAIIENPGPNIQTSAPFQENDFTLSTLGVGQTSREIIRWAYEPSSESGDVSPEVYIYQHPELYYNSKYVVCALNQINEEGLPPLDQVRSEVEGKVKNRKKAEWLINSLESEKDLNTLASQYNTSIDTAKGVSFITDFISNLGEEPLVAAYAYQSELEEVSGPIEGDRGVYFIKPFNRTQAEGPINTNSLRQSFTNQMATQSKAGLIQSLRKSAKIKDYRYKFY